eukprot:Sspe_Gene.37609::Locus_18157_Transcript_1_2_Confidence_0.667_Length_2284::g.37609::m.37609
MLRLARRCCGVRATQWRRCTTVTHTAVHRDNIDSTLPTFKEALRESTFITFDCELTGLPRDLKQGLTALEPPEKRYRALRTLLERRRTRPGRPRRCGFIVAELGVGCFVFCKASQTYRVQLFSFLLSPLPERCDVDSDVRFECLASSLGFLATYGFDFNRWLRDGCRRGKQVGQVWRELLRAGETTPVYGYHCLLDVLMLWRQLEGHLPPTLPAFQRAVARAFPVLTDLKHVVSAEAATLLPATTFDSIAALKRASLGQLHDMLPSCVTVPKWHPAPHTAGGDSFMTGVVAISLLNLLRRPVSEPPHPNVFYVAGSPHVFGAPPQPRHALIASSPIYSTSITTAAEAVDAHCDIFWVRYGRRAVVVLHTEQQEDELRKVASGWDLQRPVEKPKMTAREARRRRMLRRKAAVWRTIRGLRRHAAEQRKVHAANEADLREHAELLLENIQQRQLENENLRQQLADTRERLKEVERSAPPVPTPSPTVAARTTQVHRNPRPDSRGPPPAPPAKGTEHSAIRAASKMQEKWRPSAPPRDPPRRAVDKAAVITPPKQPPTAKPLAPTQSVPRRGVPRPTTNTQPGKTTTSSSGGQDIPWHRQGSALSLTPKVVCTGDEWEIRYYNNAKDILCIPLDRFAPQNLKLLDCRNVRIFIDGVVGSVMVMNCDEVVVYMKDFVAIAHDVPFPSCLEVEQHGGGVVRYGCISDFTERGRPGFTPVSPTAEQHMAKWE